MRITQHGTLWIEWRVTAGMVGDMDLVPSPPVWLLSEVIVADAPIAQASRPKLDQFGAMSPGIGFTLNLPMMPFAHREASRLQSRDTSAFLSLTCLIITMAWDLFAVTLSCSQSGLLGSCLLTDTGWSSEMIQVPGWVPAGPGFINWVTGLHCKALASEESGEGCWGCSRVARKRLI